MSVFPSQEMNNTEDIFNVSYKQFEYIFTFPSPEGDNNTKIVHA